MNFHVPILVECCISRLCGVYCRPQHRPFDATLAGMSNGADYTVRTPVPSMYMVSTSCSCTFMLSVAFPAPCRCKQSSMLPRMSPSQHHRPIMSHTVEELEVCQPLTRHLQSHLIQRTTLKLPEQSRRNGRGVLRDGRGLGDLRRRRVVEWVPPCVLETVSVSITKT
jgi:hypothetical protein